MAISRTEALLWPIYNPAWVNLPRPHRYDDPHKCTVAALVGPPQDEVCIYPLWSSSDVPLVPWGHREGKARVENRKGEKKPGGSGHLPKAQGVSFYTLHPELMPLIWFVQGRDTLQSCLIHSVTLNYNKWVRVCVCVCAGVWVNDWTFIMRWQWTIRKTDVIIKSIRIWYMAPSRCSPQPLFQRYHCFSAPEIIHNHSLSSFPPSSPAWLKWATGVMRIVWLTLTSKKTPLRCQKLLKHGDRMKGKGAVESKQISSWLFMLLLGLWDFVGSWKYMRPQVKTLLDAKQCGMCLKW